MPIFSKASKAQLATCHPKLQKILNEAIELVDFTVLEGFRNEADQNAAFARGDSQVRWPNGKHNTEPSRAVDITPYPVSWDETPAQAERLAFLAGVVFGVALHYNIKLRWGGDWDGDLNIAEEKFRDRYHIELASTEA